MTEQMLKFNESKAVIMLIKSNLRINITHEFGIFDVEACTLIPVDTSLSFGVKLDPELSFKKQIDIVIKKCSFQIHNICAVNKISRSKVFVCIGSLTCDIWNWLLQFPLSVCLIIYKERSSRLQVGQPVLLLLSSPGSCQGKNWV